MRITKEPVYMNYEMYSVDIIPIKSAAIGWKIDIYQIKKARFRDIKSIVHSIQLNDVTSTSKLLRLCAQQDWISLIKEVLSDYHNQSAEDTRKEQYSDARLKELDKWDGVIS